MKPNRPTEPIKIIDGHKFYALDKADTLLHSRYLLAEIENMFIQHGVSKDFLMNIIDLLTERATNNNNINEIKKDIFAIAENLRNRIGMLSEMRYYEKLATILFLMDEEPNEYKEENQKEKIKVWSKNENDRVFFCLEAYKFFNKLSSISTIDIISAWEALNERLIQLPKEPILMRK